MKARELIEQYKAGKRDFGGADLYRADLSGADLSGANLSGADLSRANLYGANLADTILDPLLACPHYTARQLIDAGFSLEGDFVLGWRTAESQHCGSAKYKPGAIYTAHWFSIDQTTQCHPGLYFAPISWLRREYRGPFVRVAAVRGEIVRAGDKWRAKRLLVLPEED